MDPLSITASLIAILQLTSEAIKYLVDVKDAPKECQLCRADLLNLLSPLLSLKDQAERARSGDLWFEQLRRLNIHNGPLEQYKEALELLLSKVDVAGGFEKHKMRLRWRFTKKQVESVQERIERLKNLIAIALTMDHMTLSEAIKADTHFIQTSLLQVQADVETTQNLVRTVEMDTKKIWDAQNREQHLAILEWLSSTDYSSTQHDLISRRQEGTAQWFLDSPEFIRWTKGPEKILFCPGIPGAGKTMMAAVAINHLSRTHEGDDVAIAYIFCSYKMQADQDIYSLIAALLKQLGPRSLDTMAQLEDLHNRHFRRGSKPALDELLKSLMANVEHATDTCIIIDALDELSNRDGARNQFINELINLQVRSTVRVLFTSRFIPEVTDRFRSNINLEVRASEEDIRRLVNGQLSRAPRCVRRDENLQSDLQNSISGAADGMFLLAQLHLDSICAQTSPKTVRSKLASLRKGSEALEVAYKDAIARIDGQLLEHRLLAQRALCWISYSERHLTAQELNVALAIEPGESDFDSENLNDLDEVVSFCAGLITIDQESGIVRLVHYTTQEYLERIRHTWAPTMQHEIAVACLTYLSFEEFRSGSCMGFAALKLRLSSFPFLEYAARFWANHVRPVEESTIALAMGFLREEASVASVTQVIRRVRFKTLGFNDVVEGYTALQLVASCGLSKLLQQLLKSELVKHDKKDERDLDMGSLLYFASGGGQEHLVEELLDNGVDVNAQGGLFGNALKVASYRNHEQVVNLLLNRGADVNIQGGLYDNATQIASHSGNENIVKLLLNKGADVNAKTRTLYGSAVSVASSKGHAQIVKMLIDAGADLEAQNESSGPALWRASFSGHEKIVKLLLDNGADVNAKSANNGDALVAATVWGHEQIVRLLLSRGADVNAQHSQYNNALYAASAAGSEQIVKLLLDEGANVNVQGGYFGNPLQAASAKNNEQVVKLLLDKGADVNARGGYYGSALFAAMYARAVPVIHLLLQSDASSAITDQHGWTTSMLASALSFQPIKEIPEFSKGKAEPEMRRLSAPKRVRSRAKWKGFTINGHRITTGASFQPSRNLCVKLESDHPLFPTQSLSYFEISIKEAGTGGTIGIGVRRKDYIGGGQGDWGPRSCVYHANDGSCFHQDTGNPYGPIYGSGDTVGCGLDLNQDELFFTLNGIKLPGIAKDLTGQLFAFIVIGSRDADLTVNFGASTFKYRERHGEFEANFQPKQRT